MIKKAHKEALIRDILVAIAPAILKEQERTSRKIEALDTDLYEKEDYHDEAKAQMMSRVFELIGLSLHILECYDGAFESEGDSL